MYHSSVKNDLQWFKHVTSLNFNFLAKFILVTLRIGINQTQSLYFSSLGPSTRAKINSHIQSYFIQASKQVDKIKWIPVLKPLKQSLLQKEASFSLPERIGRISPAILNNKNETSQFWPKYQTSGRPSSRSTKCKSQEHATCLLCIWSSGRQAICSSFSKSEMLSTNYIYQSKEIKNKSLS